MRAIVAIALAWGFLSPCPATSPKESHRPQDLKVEFGVRIAPDQGTTLTGYALITVRDGKNIAYRQLDQHTFVMMASGKWPCGAANRNRVDLFQENQVVDCYEIMDSLTDKHIGAHCGPCDSLWKVRFKEHPTEYEVYGWSDGLFVPSKVQQVYLMEEFGVHNITQSFFQGNSLWKLLKSVQDDKWIKAYKAL